MQAPGPEIKIWGFPRPYFIEKNCKSQQYIPLRVDSENELQCECN